MLLYEATIFLIAAVIAVPLAMRLGLGSVLGYLLAGIAIGPLLGLIGGAQAEDLQHFAEFGVVMMLFLIGLELSPQALWDMRHRLLGLGGLQIVLTTILLSLGAWALGMPVQTAVAVGLIFSLSSTAIVLQTLSEKGLMQTGGGRNTFSVLLTQDIAVIPMLALLPLLALGLPARIGDDGSILRSGVEAPQDAAKDHAISLVEGLPGWGVTLVTLAMVALVVVLGVYATRPIFRFIHQTRLRELYTAFALLIVVATASMMTLVGLSPALGTFLAGVVLANTEFRHELESDLEPFKGLLLGLFFITVGAGTNFAIFLKEPFVILGLTLAVMGIKGAVLYALAVAFGIRGRDRWLFTLGLAQAGEFGFVLVTFSVGQNVLGTGTAQTLLLVISLTMLLTPLAFIFYERVAARIAEAHVDAEADEIDEANEIIIAGVGRFGQVVNRMAQMAGVSTTVLDHNLATVELMRRFGFKGFFGDPTRPELLQAAGLATAKVLVVALDDKEAALKLVRYARRANPEIKIIARAHDRVQTYRLYRAGADDIVRELFDSSVRAGRYALERVGLSEFDAATSAQFFWKRDREALRELAALWSPDVPISENTAYVQRATEMDRDLETALVRELEENRDGETPEAPDAAARQGA